MFLGQEHKITIDYNIEKIVVSDGSEDNKRVFSIKDFKDKINHFTSWNGSCPVCQGWGEEVWICSNGHITTFSKVTMEIHSFSHHDNKSYSYPMFNPQLGIGILSEKDIDLKVNTLINILNNKVCPLCICECGFQSIIRALEINYCST